MVLNRYSSVLRRSLLAAALFVSSLSAVFAQDTAGLRIVGNVTDEKGEPLVGATIYAKNDKNVNAITDLDGKYTIVVPEKWTVLVYDYVGFVTKEETVGDRKVINVELVENIGQLKDMRSEHICLAEDLEAVACTVNCFQGTLLTNMHFLCYNFINVSTS